MFKIYQTSTNTEIASADSFDAATELAGILESMYGLCEVR